MAFNFAAVSYIFALIGDAVLIFFSIFHVIAFDELKTDYKNPIDQCNSLNPLKGFLWTPQLAIPARITLGHTLARRIMAVIVMSTGDFLRNQGRAFLQLPCKLDTMSRIKRVLASKEVVRKFLPSFQSKLVLPEYLLHIAFNILFLLSGQWLSLCLNVPLIAYHINRYRKRPVMSGPGLYDPTNIMNTDVLTQCQREGWVKLAFYLLSFFYYLYGMIHALIST